MQTRHVEAHCLLPHDPHRVWAVVRAATPQGLWRKLRGDVAHVRCYRIEGGRRRCFDLAAAVRP